MSRTSPSWSTARHSTSARRRSAPPSRDSALVDALLGAQARGYVARTRFLPVIIQHPVWLYLRFTLSYRAVEELLAERGSTSLTRLSVSGAEIRTGDRATATPAPSAAEQSLASPRPSSMTRAKERLTQNEVERIRL